MISIIMFLSLSKLTVKSFFYTHQKFCGQWNPNKSWTFLFFSSNSQEKKGSRWKFRKVKGSRWRRNWMDNVKRSCGIREKCWNGTRYEKDTKRIQEQKRNFFFFVLFAPFAKNFRKYIRPGQSQNFSQISAIFLLAKNRYYYLFLETSGSRHSFLEEMWLVLAPTVTWNHRIEEGAPWRVMRCIPKKWNLKNHWDDCNHGFWEEEWVFCKRLPVTECSLPLSFLSKNLYCKPSCEIMN